jgi:hypothetical protein
MYSDVTSVGCNYDLVDYWLTANEERKGGRLFIFHSLFLLIYYRMCVAILYSV